MLLQALNSLGYCSEDWKIHLHTDDVSTLSYYDACEDKTLKAGVWIFVSTTVEDYDFLRRRVGDPDVSCVDEYHNDASLFYNVTDG